MYAKIVLRNFKNVERSYSQRQVPFLLICRFNNTRYLLIKIFFEIPTDIVKIDLAVEPGILISYLCKEINTPQIHLCIISSFY